MDVLTFLSQISENNNRGYGYGAGSGCGNESSQGCGHGFNDGFGHGHGSGSGSDSGSGGSGDGLGHGYGFGFVSGFGHGYEVGFGNGWGNYEGDCNELGNGYKQNREYKFLLKSIGGLPVTKIDGIYTHIRRVHSASLASAYIFGDDDFTRRDTRVAVVNGCAAHGETARQALTDAGGKYFATINIDERAAAFRDEFPALDVEYDASDFYRWHGILTGSCVQGRRLFAERHDIDVGHDKLTLRRFFEITANDYGADRLREVRKLYRATTN
jgi:hypothetical protein